MVHSMTGWRAWPRGAIVLAGLAGASLAHASSDPLDATVPDQAIEARFNAAAQQTLVTGRAAPISASRCPCRKNGGGPKKA